MSGWPASPVDDGTLRPADTPAEVLRLRLADEGIDSVEAFERHIAEERGMALEKALNGLPRALACALEEESGRPEWAFGTADHMFIHAGSIAGRLADEGEVRVLFLGDGA